MNANTPYEIIQYAAAKNQQGYISPDDYNLVINQAQRQYLDYLLGEYQKYQVGRPIAVVEFGQNEKIRTSLAPLIYGAILNPFPYNGISPFPSDFEQVDAMWGIYGHYNIRFAQQDRLDSYVHSSIDPIAQNPIYLIQHEGFHFFPEDIGQTRLSYVRNPPTILWAYYNDNNGRPVWDEPNSISPVWSDFDMMNIIVRALSLIGCNLQLSSVIQYSQDIIKTGQ